MWAIFFFIVGNMTWEVIREYDGTYWSASLQLHLETFVPDKQELITRLRLVNLQQLIIGDKNSILTAERNKTCVFWKSLKYKSKYFWYFGLSYPIRHESKTEWWIFHSRILTEVQQHSWHWKFFDQQQLRELVWLEEFLDCQNYTFDMFPKNVETSTTFIYISRIPEGGKMRDPRYEFAWCDTAGQLTKQGQANFLSPVRPTWPFFRSVIGYLLTAFFHSIIYTFDVWLVWERCHSFLKIHLHNVFLSRRFKIFFPVRLMTLKSRGCLFRVWISLLVNDEKEG